MLGSLPPQAEEAASPVEVEPVVKVVPAVVEAVSAVAGSPSVRASPEAWSHLTTGSPAPPLGMLTEGDRSFEAGSVFSSALKRQMDPEWNCPSWRESPWHWLKRRKETGLPSPRSSKVPVRFKRGQATAPSAMRPDNERQPASLEDGRSTRHGRVSDPATR
jgi:hypothetical protein